MNESHSRAIIVLLVAILCVMLFGASAVLKGFGWGIATAAALALVGLGVFIAVKLVAQILEFLPKAPRLIAAFLRGWLLCLIAPITAPIEAWRYVRDRRDQGEKIGAMYAGYTLICSAISGVFIWLFAFLPLVFSLLGIYDVSTGH